MASWKTWGLIAAGFGLVALAVEGGDSAPAVTAAGGATTTIGTGSLLQTRPIPAWSSLSSDGQKAYVNIAQQQLGGPLGYDGVVANGDWNDPGTTAAITRFLIGNSQAARAYGYTGTNTPADVVALLKAIDDLARTQTGGDPSTLSDYVSPSTASSSGIASAALRAMAPPRPALRRPARG